MKLSLTLTVYVDPDDWAREYGNGHEHNAVKADVESYILDAVQQSYAGAEGLLYGVTLNREQVSA